MAGEGRSPARWTALLLLLAGTCAGLLLVEGVLAAAGWVYARSRRRAAPAPEDGRRILCVGDSFTFGIGAPEGRSYPDQLQELLEEAAPGRFQVVNRAEPGSNSSQVLARLFGDLEEVRPEAVIVLAGYNDYSLDQSNYWRVADLSRLPLKERLRLRLGGLLEGLRVWKLARAAAAALREEKGDPYDRWLSLDALSEEEALAELKRLEAGRRKAPAAFDDWLRLGIFLHRARRFDEAAEAFRKAIAAHPDDAEAHFRLGWMLHLLRDMPASKRALEAALDLDAEHSRARHMYESHRDRGPPPGEWLGALLEYDLSRIVRASRGYGASVVLMNYPVPQRHEVSDLLRAVDARLAAAPGVAAVDNGAVFREQPRPEALFSGDEPELFVSHPNEKGYAVIAHNALAGLKEAGVLR